VSCDDDRIVFAVIMAVVVALVLLRACIPPEYHHPAERPATPPESFHSPAGE